MITPCPIHAVAVEAFIRKTPKFVVLAAVSRMALVTADFCPYTSSYSGFFIDPHGAMRPLFLKTDERSASTISALRHLLDGTDMMRGVEIVSLDLVNGGQGVRVVLSSIGVCQSIVVPRHEVVWGVVRHIPDPQVVELFQ